MSRLEQLRRYLTEETIDAFLVTGSKNIRYLANFTGSFGALVITKDQSFIISDFRYITQAKEQAAGFEFYQATQGLIPAIALLVKELNIQSLAIETHQMTAETYLQLNEQVTAELIESPKVIETIRQVKDEEELALIKYACQITDKAFEHILSYLKIGQTEIEIANELERFLKSKGASSMSFDTIVASGVRSSMPHGVASDKKIEAGDIITFDFGCYYKGYSSDLTRTIAIGSIDPKLEEIYYIVLEAHNEVIRHTKPGMTGAQVDALARDYITQKGYGEYFGHSTGHGLGLDVHEEPRATASSDQVFAPGMVVTNEPGIYIPNLGGVRIEDDLLITKDGVESLNRAPKDLIILPID